MSTALFLVITGGIIAAAAAFAFFAHRSGADKSTIERTINRP